MRPLPLALLLAACAGARFGPERLYTGPRRPRAEVARVRLDDFADRVERVGGVAFEVALVGVNGRRLPREQRFVELVPGHYRLGIRWTRFELDEVGDYENDPDETLLWRDVEKGIAVIELDARPGDTYELDWSDTNRLPTRFLGR